MKYKLAIFDLDGTILNTLDDLADSLNHVLYLNDLDTYSIDDVRKMVGNGILNLVKDACPKDMSERQIKEVFDQMISYYRNHCADKTSAYEDIPFVIDTLKKAGIKTAVVSNKADALVQLLCEKYFPGQFDYAVGERLGIAKKPSPDSVNQVLRFLNVKPCDAVYVGDSEVDIATASNAQMNHIIVSWGFRDLTYLQNHGAKVIANQPKEILEIME